MASLKLKNGCRADEELVEAVWSCITEMSEMTYLCLAARARNPHLFEFDGLDIFFRERGIDSDTWKDEDIMNILLSTIGKDGTVVHPCVDNSESHHWVAGVFDTRVKEIHTGLEDFSILQIDDQ